MSEFPISTWSFSTVKQEMSTAIKVREFNLSHIYKAFIIYVFLFPTWILNSKVLFSSKKLSRETPTHENSESKLLAKVSCFTVHISQCKKQDVLTGKWVKLRFKNQEVSGSKPQLDRWILEQFLFPLPQRGWILKNPVQFGLLTNLIWFYTVDNR